MTEMKGFWHHYLCCLSVSSRTCCIVLIKCVLSKVPQLPGGQQIFPHGPDQTINRSQFADKLVFLHRKEKQ